MTKQKQIQFTQRHRQYFSVLIPGSRKLLKLLQLKESGEKLIGYSFVCSCIWDMVQYVAPTVLELRDLPASSFWGMGLEVSTAPPCSTPPSLFWMLHSQAKTNFCRNVDTQILRMRVEVMKPTVAKQSRLFHWNPGCYLSSTGQLLCGSETKLVYTAVVKIQPTNICTALWVGT